MAKTTQTDELELLKEVRSELTEHLKSYQNESAAWASFEKYSGLHRKTLKGFLNSERTPYPQTLLSFFKWKYKTSEVNEIIPQLPIKTRQYLSYCGYNLQDNKKDITHIVCKSLIHYQIYLATEDNQTVKKSAIKEQYGKRGEEALNDLIAAEIIENIDQEIITTGHIRSSEDLNYLRQSMKLMQEILPWERLENDIFDQGITLSLGNMVIANKDLQELALAFGDLRRKICLLHSRGIKTAEDERQNLIYNYTYFSSSVEGASL